LKFYGLGYHKLTIIIAEGYESFCIPLFCIEGKPSMLYDDRKIIPFADYENCKDGDIAGFYIKLKHERDIYHELSHAKRMLERKELKYETIEEIVVEIYSFFKMLQFMFYSTLLQRV